MKPLLQEACLAIEQLRKQKSLLTEIQVQNAFPLAWRCIPKVYREQEKFRFQLTENGVLLYHWDSAPKDHKALFAWDGKRRKWEEYNIFLLQNHKLFGG